jgi:hypothetical protein
VNQGELLAALAARLGAAASSADNAKEWTEMQRALNQGVLDILSRTRIYVRKVDLATTTGVREYDLSGEVLRMYSVYRDGGEEPLQEVDATQLGIEGSRNVFAMPGFNRIALGWEPEVNGAITAWYTPRPVAMTAIGNDPSSTDPVNYGGIPPQFHSAILDYASWQVADAVGDAQTGRGERYRILYEGQDGNGGVGTHLGRIKKQVNRRVANNSREGIRPRLGDRLIGDVDSRFWVG